MRAQKDLAAVGDDLVLDDPEEKVGRVTAQMLAGGAGTVVLEGTLRSDVKAADVPAGDWVALKVTNSTTAVAADNIAAPGLCYAEDPGYNRVRARKTVGVASCPIILSKTNY